MKNLKRFVVLSLFLVPASVHAIDSATDSNTPIQCTTGVEVYYPRGDAWAFLPEDLTNLGSCHGTDPKLNDTQGACTASDNFYETSVVSPCTDTNWGVDAKAPDGTATPGDGTGTPPNNALEDRPGHCLWVFFPSVGPRCTTNCPTGSATEASATELADQTVFSDMRKWTGYNSGQQLIPSGTTNEQWTCPQLSGGSTGGSTGGTSSSSTGGSGPTFDTASLDYTFNVTNAQPSLSFYRGKTTIPQKDSDGNYEKGDDSSCFAQCLSGQTCENECSSSSKPPCTEPTGQKLYDCDSNPNSVDPSTAVYRFNSVRNVVQYVNGSGDWQNKMGYDAATLAVTETIFWPDNGVSITSDMMINNDNIDWAWKDLDVATSHDYFGCDPTSDTSCYYLETITTHESGHFIGFGHTDCQGAVMYSTAQTTDQIYTLDIGAEAGACALYRPIPAADTDPAEARDTTKTHDNEGCFEDSTCPSGEKCVLSASSFYQLPGEDLSSVKSYAAKIPHRGVCAKTCTSVGDTSPQNPDCSVSSGSGAANYYGRICQPYSADGSVAYCLPGSPYLPSQGAADTSDLCAACASASDCSSEVCLNLAGAGISATDIANANAPPDICSVRCYPASGCDPGYDCVPAGTSDNTYGCVPHDLASCVAAQARPELDQPCDENTVCDTGLVCYALINGDACLEECDADTPCGTTNYACYFPQTTDPTSGDTETSTIGACFKETMEEGDACTIPETAVCGLECTSDSQGNQTCVQNPNLVCAGTAPNYDDAACYAVCSPNDTSVPCPHSSQTCTALPSDSSIGVCLPLAAKICLLQTGVACQQDTDCETGECADVGTTKVCTNACDLTTKTGCPTGTQCVSGGSGSASGVCAPTGKPLASNCPAAQGAGCGCRSSGPNLLESALALALVLILRRRRR